MRFQPICLMASKRMLIVDDEPSIGLSLQLILERDGYSVSICHSVEEFRRESPAARKLTQAD